MNLTKQQQDLIDSMIAHSVCEVHRAPGGVWFLPGVKDQYYLLTTWWPSTVYGLCSKGLLCATGKESDVPHHFNGAKVYRLVEGELQ